MSNPVQELRRLLGIGASSETGEVVSVAKGVLVSTRSGTKRVSSSIPLKVGDSVLVSGGQVQGKVVHQDKLPAYYL